MHLDLAHILEAAGNDAFGLSGHDGIGSGGNRLEPGGTETVDGLAGRGQREARAVGQQAADVQALLGLGDGTAADQVLRQGRVKARGFREDALQNLRAEVDAAGVAEAALDGLGDGAAAEGNNHCIFTFHFPLLNF